MRDKKMQRAMERTAPTAPARVGPPKADQFLRPLERVQPPLESILATNHKARIQIEEHRERQRRGLYEFNPEVARAYEDAERSRIGRPGGSTFTKDNIAGKRE